MLEEKNRLKKRKEFAYLYNNGNAKHTANLTVVYLPTKNRTLKVGFSLSKKVGKAHTRNLVKRRLRAILREIIPSMPDNFNVVIIGKSGVENLTFDQLKSETFLLLKKAGFVV